MKRYTLRILLCLCLGVVTTVGVAWGCGIFVTELNKDSREAVAELNHTEKGWVTEAWFVHRLDGFGSEIYTSTRIKGIRTNKPRRDIYPKEMLPTWSNLFVATKRYTDLPTNTENRESRWNLAYGLPFSSLWCEVIRINYEPEFLIKGGYRIGWRLGSRWGKKYPIVIPIRVIWSGFLINTLFYGVIWFGMFFGISATRRTIRRKRGHCPMCGYDLRGDFESRCSECGWGRGVPT